MTDHANAPARCERCRTPLSGRATRTCSNACRQALYRASKAVIAAASPKAPDHIADACGYCAKPTGWNGVGRRRRWCSDACKTAACRERKLNR